MGLMEGVQKINGIWKIRRRIPADCAAAFGVKEFYTRSLGTSDRKQAMQLAAPLLADIDERIAAIRAGASEEPLREVLKALLPLDRQRAFDAIASWRRRTIQAASEQGWSGLLPPLDNDESVRLSGVRIVLRTGGQPEGFDDHMAGALGVPVEHPVLRRAELREAFRSAWSDVEDRIDEFRHDRFDGWPEDEEPASTAAALPASGVTLLDLFDLWAASKTLPPRQRGYVERLSEFLGAPDISRITPIDLDRFLVELRKWPNTKRDLSGMTFLAVIATAEKQSDYRRLHDKTVWNWTTTYKAMFEFAVQRDLLAKNPAANMMKKPSAETSSEREPYEAEDLAVIFEAPLFRGNDGKGMRDKKGDKVIQDHRYWLPILAHYTGARVGELASLHADEVREEDRIWFIDLTERSLSGDRRVKNRSARRTIPLHDDLVELGFVDHVRRTVSDMVFPELDGPGKASDQFVKWWGRWCERTAPLKGQGIDDPSKTFHSFRHGWKRAARQSGVKEEVHDLISGHAGGNGVARSYGRGADLKTLKEAVDALNLPSILD